MTQQAFNVQNGIEFADGTVQITAASTSSSLTNSGQSFSLNSDGSITLPKGVAFNAPAHDLSWQGWDFITIQGTTGYYSNFTVDSVNGGEGTAIALNAGNGGESGDFIHGGRGGDIVLNAGTGQHGGQGGYVNISAGTATYSNAGVRGGDINITAGHAPAWQGNSSAVGTGGDLNLQAGWGNNVGGSVKIKTSNDHANENITSTWTFDENGVLTLPAGGDIKNSSNQSVLGGAYANTVGSFGTDKGVGPNYASNNPAVLFSDDDMVIRTGGTAAAGSPNYGAMYIAAAEDLFIGTTHMANLVDSTGPGPSDYATYINFNYNGTTIDITAGSNTLSVDSATGLLYNGNPISALSSLVNNGHTLSLQSNGYTLAPNNVVVSGDVDVTRTPIGWISVKAAQSDNVWYTSTAVDPSTGDIYAAGGRYDGDDIGNDTPLLVKYDKHGVEQWSLELQYNYSNFGGSTYTVEFDAANNQIILVHSDWYANNRIVITKVNTSGSIIGSSEITDQNNQTNYPRGLTITSSGTWVIVGEKQNDIALTTGTQVGGVGSTTGVLFMDRTSFSPDHLPTSNSDWYIRTTDANDNYTDDFIYYVNQYYDVPTTNILSTASGYNLSLTIEYSVTDGSVQNWYVNNSGVDYNVGDLVWVKGSTMGVTTSSYALILATDVSIATVNGNTEFTTTADLSTVSTDLATTGTVWNFIASDSLGIGSGGQVNISSVTLDAGVWTVTAQGDYGITATDSVVLFKDDSEATELVARITSVDTNNGNWVNNLSLWGRVNNPLIKLDTQGSTDFSILFKETIPNSQEGTTSQVTFSVTAYPQGANITNQWTWTDGTNSGYVDSFSQNGDVGTVTLLNNVPDGPGVTDGNPVTFTSGYGLYQPYYTSNNDGFIVTNRGAGTKYGWGSTGNQRFNVVAISTSTEDIYVGGYDSSSDHSVIAKFTPDGSTQLWNKRVQNTDIGYDDDCHGIALAVENGTEYVYAIGYDDYNGGTLYKFNGATGDHVYSTQIYGQSANNSWQWRRAPGIHIASNGDVVVAGIGEIPGSPGNNRQVQVVKLNPDGSSLYSAWEVSHVTGLYDRYEGDEGEGQFKLAVIDGVEYLIMAVYNEPSYDQGVLLKLPINDMSSVSSAEFAIRDVTSDVTNADAIRFGYTNTDINMFTEANVHASDLVLNFNNNLIGSRSPYQLVDAVKINAYGLAGGGELLGVKDIAFEDGSHQATAYSPLMGSVVDNGSYWYNLKLTDAGKFIFCNNGIHGINLADDAGFNAPIGFAFTVMAPSWDVQLNPQNYNTSPTIIVAGQGSNSNQYSGWYLRQNGMATVIKTAANTWWISGGTLEAV